MTSNKPTSRYLCACPDLDYFRFVDHSALRRTRLTQCFQGMGPRRCDFPTGRRVQHGEHHWTVLAFPIEIPSAPLRRYCRRHSPSFGKLSVLLLTPLGKGTTRKLTFCPAPRGHVSNGVQGPSIGTICNHLTAGFLSAHKGRHFSRPHDQSR